MGAPSSALVVLVSGPEPPKMEGLLKMQDIGLQLGEGAGRLHCGPLVQEVLLHRILGAAPEGNGRSQELVSGV